MTDAQTDPKADLPEKSRKDVPARNWKDRLRDYLPEDWTYRGLRRWKLLLFLADTRLFFFALLWLCFLTFAGTLVQTRIGLYQAQELYFSSFVLWLWILPLPGGYTTMGVVFVGLLVKLVFYSEWKNGKRLGTLITHFGAFLLLFGGFLTAVASEEGSMVIPEGSSSSMIRDYHKIELAIIDRSGEKTDRVIAFAEGWLAPGKRLRHDSLPFELEILEYNRNTQILRRKSAAPEGYRGFGKLFLLKEIPLAKDETRNTAGVVFRLRCLAEGSESCRAREGIYTIFENMRIPQTMSIDSRDLLLEIRHELRPLPFTIELLDFEKKEHPGTRMAKSYKSIINLIDKGASQRIVISMNHPLRHGGYTFYQSSFMQSGMSETTVLAVVKNAGRLFPYISSLIMCVGLLLHLLIKMPALFTGDRKK